MLLMEHLQLLYKQDDGGGIQQVQPLRQHFGLAWNQEVRCNSCGSLSTGTFEEAVTVLNVP